MFARILLYEFVTRMFCYLKEYYCMKEYSFKGVCKIVVHKLFTKTQDWQETSFESGTHIVDVKIMAAHT